jgi:hypothetical protein
VKAGPLTHAPESFSNGHAAAHNDFERHRLWDTECVWIKATRRPGCEGVLPALRSARPAI